MAHPEATSPESPQMYWVASYPQPVGTPLCSGADGINQGLAVWGQTYSIAPVSPYIPFEVAPTDYGDWAQVCVPVHWQSFLSSPVETQSQFVLPATCCATPVNFANAFPQALLQQSCSTYPSNSTITQPATTLNDVHALESSSSDVPCMQTQIRCYDELIMQGIDVDADIHGSGNSLHLQPPSPVQGMSQRWADIVDEEPNPPNVSTDSPVDQEVLPARRRRRQRNTDLEQDAVAAAPVQQSMGEVLRNEEYDNVTSGRTCTQKLADWVLHQMGAGGSTREATVASVHHMAISDKNSCRAMQLALENAPAKDAVALALGLRGHVRETIRSMHGNYVLQKIIEVVPASIASFIAEELIGVAAEVSRHRFGCRVLCRLLEHISPRDKWISSLVDEVLMEALSLCRHTYGNYVVQHVLEFGLEYQQRKVVLALRKDINGNARNQYASHGIEKALSFCPGDSRDGILEDLFCDPNNLLELAEHQFGCYVVRALLKLPEDSLSKVEGKLRPIAAQLAELNRRQRRVAAGVADRAASRVTQTTSARRGSQRS